MVNWTAEKDHTILRGILGFHDIKNSKALLEHLAKEIGEGCTPKAVACRLSNLRNASKGANSNGGSTPTPTKVAVTPRTPRTPASGRGRGKTAPKKTMSDVETSSDDGTDEYESMASPSVGHKRPRASKTPKSYAESDVTTGDEDEEEEFTPVTKRVKAGLVEGKGIAGMANGDGDVTDED